MTTVLEPIDARILIVDDEPANLAFLRQLLAQAGYHNLLTLSDFRRAIAVIQEWDPDLVLLALHPSNSEAIALLDNIRHKLALPELPIVVITADASTKARMAALEAGATDFVLTPIDTFEVSLRVRNLLRLRKLHRELTDQRTLLELRVAERTSELAASQREILQRLALASEYRDDMTGRHTERVGDLSVRIASQMGLPAPQIEIIRFATPLHDIGKIAIPDRILLKPGPLTPAEYEEIKLHVMVGASILSGGTSPILQMAEQVALTHHERWDGSGYLGLVKMQIPMAARIVAVADVYDALISVRPYKEAWPVAVAVAEIVRLSGIHFDPEVIEAFEATISDEPVEIPALPAA